MPTVGLTPLLSGQFFDNSGQILSGGLLYTYLAGTSTFAATYTDSTGSQALTNPVVLDASGRAVVWLVAGTAYKLVLKDATAVTLWTVDGVTVPASVTGLPTGVTITTGTATLTAVNGQTSPLIASGFHDAKKMILSVMANLTGTFSNANGLTALSIGDPGMIDRWGSGIALASGTQPGLRFGGLEYRKNQATFHARPPTGASPHRARVRVSA